jgi:hypothetical protein
VYPADALLPQSPLEATEWNILDTPLCSLSVASPVGSDQARWAKVLSARVEGDPVTVVSSFELLLPGLNLEGSMSLQVRPGFWFGHAYCAFGTRDIPDVYSTHPVTGRPLLDTSEEWTQDSTWISAVLTATADLRRLNELYHLEWGITLGVGLSSVDRKRVRSSFFGSTCDAPEAPWESAPVHCDDAIADVLCAEQSWHLFLVAGVSFGVRI